MTAHLGPAGRGNQPGRVGGRGNPAEGTVCRQARSEGAHLGEVRGPESGAENGRAGKEAAKAGLPDHTGPEPQSKASKSFKQGVRICSDLGCKVKNGPETAGIKEEAVETSHCHRGDT